MPVSAKATPGRIAMAVPSPGAWPKRDTMVGMSDSRPATMPESVGP